MMRLNQKMFPIIGVLFVLGCNALRAQSGKPESFDVSRLQGIAEDLWGNRINLSNYNKGVVLLHPFSPANCGYCLVDGEFIKENLFRNNEDTHGASFLQCLCNPQLDIYTYTKHFRESSRPVLTFPPGIFRYHRDGFPFLAAFRDGKLLRRGVLTPYEENFHSLCSDLWPGHDVHLRLPSSVFMASRFVIANKSNLGVLVYPDDDKTHHDRASRRHDGSRAVSVKYESELQGTDLRKNLWFTGKTEQFKFAILKDKKVPLRITSSKLRVGKYEFPVEDVGLYACFPNPYNRERYLILEVSGRNVKKLRYQDHVDLTISCEGDHGVLEVLMEGFFERSADNHWEFSDAKTRCGERMKDFCQSGTRLVPSGSSKEERVRRPDIIVSDWSDSPEGKRRMLGASDCRFPSIAVDREGICWVVWEEDGDILLSSVNRPGSQAATSVESGSSDSYNPIVTFDGTLLWVFYLNSKGGFYRLYGRSFDGVRLSDEILITEEMPFDVITPAIASNEEGKIVIAWSEWKANYRYLKCRTFEKRRLGKIRDVAIKKGDDDYANAWSPSLVMESGERAWGAWNQHYPSTLGVCAGNLVKEAASVTKLTGDIRTSERGGYPSIAVDTKGRKWVFWESDGWDVVIKKRKQKILACSYDDSCGQWTSQYNLTLDGKTDLNQTPRAVVDDRGSIWVVFSGRENDVEKPWGIYLSRLVDDKWSVPKLVSREHGNSRAPVMCTGKNNQLWICWHSGIGKDMRIEVLQLEGRRQER